jgi:hypothetical protein
MTLKKRVTITDKSPIENGKFPSAKYPFYCPEKEKV